MKYSFPVVLLIAGVSFFNLPTLKAQVASLTEMPPDKPFTSPWREAYFSGEPLQIGNRLQFFFDDYIVEDKYGLKQVLGPVTKYEGNPVFASGKAPWVNGDSISTGALTHVIYDPQEQLFKGWYLAYRQEESHNYSTLYAESKDGFTWEKPALDFFRMDNKRTNIVIHDDNETALLEEVKLDTLATDPNRRYMGLVKMVPPGEKTRCIVLMYSPDGKKWTLAPDPILFHGASDGSYSLVKDEHQDRWMLYRRPATNALIRAEEGLYSIHPMRPEKKGLNIKRRFGVTISKDLKNWTYPRGIQMLDDTDEIQNILGNKMDIDWATVTLYKGMFIGFLHLMDNLAVSRPENNHLMWSRDGLRWNRLPDKPHFIENGSPGEWDAGSILSISPVPDGDKIRIYYAGNNVPQAETRIPRAYNTGLAFMDKDRFVGLQAGPEGGYLLTREFILEGDQLLINFRSQVKTPPAHWGGQIKAEIIQAPSDQVAATPIRGFSLADCNPVTVREGDNHMVTWKNASDLSALKGKKVYIRFYLQNTTLYSFKMAN